MLLPGNWRVNYIGDTVWLDSIHEHLMRNSIFLIAGATPTSLYYPCHRHPDYTEGVFVHSTRTTPNSNLTFP